MYIFNFDIAKVMIYFHIEKFFTLKIKIFLLKNIK